jgi:hypothetical protein
MRPVPVDTTYMIRMSPRVNASLHDALARVTKRRSLSVSAEVRQDFIDYDLPFGITARRDKSGSRWMIFGPLRWQCDLVLHEYGRRVVTRRKIVYRLRMSIAALQ